MSTDADEKPTGPTPEELSEFKNAMEDTEVEIEPQTVSSEAEPTPSDSGGDRAATPKEEPTGTMPATEEPQASAPQSTPATDPWLKPYTFKGETKTLQQWHDEGKIDAVFTNANQSSHLQEKHRQQLEEQRRAKAAQEAAAQAQPTQPMTLEQHARYVTQIKEAYMPQMKAMADAGIIEKELVEDAPKLVALLMHRFSTYEQKAQQFDQRFNEIDSERSQIMAQRQQENDVNMIVRAVDEMALLGPEYAGVNDPAHRQEFYSWLVSSQNPIAEADRNTSMTMMQKGIMPHLYSKYLADTGVRPPTGDVAADAAAEQERAMAGGGGGGGGRVAAPRTPVETEFSAFAKAMREENLA